jgi:uncharacterized protein (TIGR02588 family)
MAKARRSPPPRKPQTAAGRTPLLEWIAAATGAVLAVAVIGVIAAEALSGPRTPPKLHVRALEVTPTTAGYTVEFEVENTGGSAAAAVMVAGDLTGSGAPETAEATIDYVPARSKARGGLILRGDPRAGALRLYAKGYAEP